MSEKLSVAQNRMLEDVLAGLKQPQKSIPSKYFYDEKGSELFEQITRLNKYYLTRCEKQILEQNIDEIAGCIGRKSMIVELGSGSSRKTRLLLDHVPGLVGYIPVDISKQYLSDVERQLKTEYPDIFVRAVCADYTKPFRLPEVHHDFCYYVFFYPGSTIGNFHPEQARTFLHTVAQFMVPGGGLLIGVDLKKSPEIIEAAYNDSEAITAAFNKNLLVRMNRELPADFDVGCFKHRAYYNSPRGRVEMHLVSCRTQTVHIDGKQISFEKGETIHTENSYKYSLQNFELLVSDWFRVDKVWTDEEDLFSVQYLVKK